MKIPENQRQNFQSPHPVTNPNGLPRIVPYNDPGKTILKEGTRRSHDNTTEGGTPPDLDYLLHMLNLNLQDRQKKQKGKKGTRRERMKGLFGGGPPLPIMKGGLRK